MVTLRPLNSPVYVQFTGEVKRSFNAIDSTCALHIAALNAHMFVAMLSQFDTVRFLSYSRPPLGSPSDLFNTRLHSFFFAGGVTSALPGLFNYNHSLTSANLVRYITGSCFFSSFSLSGPSINLAHWAEPLALCMPNRPPTLVLSRQLSSHSIRRNYKLRTGNNFVAFFHPLEMSCLSSRQRQQAFNALVDQSSLSEYARINPNELSVSDLAVPDSGLLQFSPLYYLRFTRAYAKACNKVFLEPLLGQYYAHRKRQLSFKLENAILKPLQEFGRRKLLTLKGPTRFFPWELLPRPSYRHERGVKDAYFNKLRPAVPLCAWHRLRLSKWVHPICRVPGPFLRSKFRARLFFDASPDSFGFIENFCKERIIRPLIAAAASAPR